MGARTQILAGSSGNKANLSRTAKLELGLGLSLAIKLLYSCVLGLSDLVCVFGHGSKDPNFINPFPAFNYN